MAGWVWLCMASGKGGESGCGGGGGRALGVRKGPKLGLTSPERWGAWRVGERGRTQKDKRLLTFLGGNVYQLLLSSFLCFSYMLNYKHQMFPELGAIWGRR